jgi:phage terminase small subunit
VAKRGAKPKPAHLRLVDGTTNVTRHGSEKDQLEKVEAAVAAFGKLVRPKHLKSHALDAWKRYIEPAAWLDASREAAAIAFCELWQEFRFAPASFPAAKHGQLRAYMSELGLTDERNRVIDESKKEKDEFFGD